MLFLPTDTEQLPLPLFLELVCFCCQKSKYSHLAITPHTKHTRCGHKNSPVVYSSELLQPILQSSYQSPVFWINPFIVQVCNKINVELSQQPWRAKSAALGHSLVSSQLLDCLSRKTKWGSTLLIPSVPGYGSCCHFSHTNPCAHLISEGVRSGTTLAENSPYKKRKGSNYLLG